MSVGGESVKEEGKGFGEDEFEREQIDETGIRWLKNERVQIR